MNCISICTSNWNAIGGSRCDLGPSNRCFSYVQRRLTKFCDLKRRWSFSLSIFFKYFDDLCLFQRFECNRFVIQHGQVYFSKRASSNHSNQIEVSDLAVRVLDVSARQLLRLRWCRDGCWVVGVRECTATHILIFFRFYHFLYVQMFAGSRPNFALSNSNASEIQAVKLFI